MRRPTNCVLFVIALRLLWAANPTPAAAQGGPFNLRCENATSPRGVRAPQPQLSWELNSNVVQRAYQILVASSGEKLKADEGDLWDSGRVISDQTTVRYQGKALSSLQGCYWKVRVWGAYYQATGYSDPASWQMGLLFFGEREAKSAPAGRGSQNGRPHSQPVTEPRPEGVGATFYIVDVGHGNAAFVVSPSGEVLLLDCGPTRATNRIYNFTEQNGIKKIDYLVVSHFEDDHMGAVAALSERIPILNFVDHGESVVYGKDFDWWKQRRGPWARPNMGNQYDESFDLYRKARNKGRHIVVKAGDRIPIKGLDAIVVTAAGRNIARPLAGTGQPNPACSKVDPRAEDDAEDGQSVGVLVRFGKFRFIYLGDMTWNSSTRLFCPNNLVGAADAYLITHHAQSLPKEMGDYYYGLSCCSPAEVWGLRPRVAILSMGALGHKVGTAAAMEFVRDSPGIEDLWETEKITAGGEAGHNPPDQFIANTGERSEQVPYIKLTARPDDGFAVTNARNGFTKDYPPRK